MNWQNQRLNENFINAEKIVNSFRYRLGSILIDAIKHPQNFLNVPKDMYLLLKEYKSKNAAKGDGTSVVETCYEDNASIKFIYNQMVDDFIKYYNYSSLNPYIQLNCTKSSINILAYMRGIEEFLKQKYINCSQESFVSIIMPVFNRADIISDAIESVLNQSYKNWELLIIDDYSEDNVEEIVSRYQDYRIRYIPNSKCKGVSAARNTGLENAKGEYIAYLDSDNDWKEDYLLIMVNELKRESMRSAIYCGQYVYQCTSEGNNRQLSYIRFGSYNHSLIKNRNYIDLNCYMHHIDLFKKYGGFSEKLSRLVDWELIHRFSSYYLPIALPCNLSNYYFEKANNQITHKQNLENNLRLVDGEFADEQLNLKSLNSICGLEYKFHSDKLPVIYHTRKRKVKIILFEYVSFEYLKICIESIKSFTIGFDYEIIVFSNYVSQEQKEYLNIVQDSSDDIKVVLDEDSSGFSHIVNTIVRDMDNDTDIIFMTNSIVAKGWIEELYRVKDKVQKAGIIVPRQVVIPHTEMMGSHVPSCIEERELDISISAYYENVLDNYKYSEYGFLVLSFAKFSTVMITRECLNQVGLLDVEFLQNSDAELAYCQKATENNFEIVYTPLSKSYSLPLRNVGVSKNNFDN